MGERDSDLFSEDSNWTSNHRLRGIAYMYVRLQFSNDIFPNGIPNISTVIKGKKVYDPRTSTTSYSANSALCVRDYLMNTRFGLSATASEVNDTIFTSCANTCDETVSITNPSGTEKRFTMNGTFRLDKSPKSILETSSSHITSCIKPIPNSFPPSPI